MANQFDSWLSSNLQLSRSTLKENQKNCSSSEIIGRKINSQYKITPQASRPKILENCPALLKNTTLRKRNKSLSKSPLRSNSQNQHKPDKYLTPELNYCLSPPRQSRKQKTLRKKISKSYINDLKSEKPKPPNLKSFLTESLNKIHLEKLDTLRKANEEKNIKSMRKEKLDRVNKKIRKKNAKQTKQVISGHPRPWGCDQRILKEENTLKSVENDEIRSKIRAEREVSRREGRKAIGLELFPERTSKSKSRSKSKVRSTSREEKIRPKKSPDPGIQVYIKQKNKTKRIVDLQKHLEESLREKERVHALERLDKTLKKKKIKAKKKKKTKICLTEEKSIEPTHSIPSIKKLKGSKLKQKTERYRNPQDNSDEFSENLKKMQERIYNAYETVRINAAIKIQAWFRSLLSQRKYKYQHDNKRLQTHEDLKNSSLSDKLSNCGSEGWTSLMHTSSKFKEFGSELMERVKEQINGKNKSKDKYKAKEKSKYKNKNKDVPEYDIEYTQKPEVNFSGCVKELSYDYTESLSNRSTPKASSKLKSINMDSSLNENLRVSTDEVLIFSLTNQKFQLKRPRELDIDSINAPLASAAVVAVYSSFESPNPLEKPNPFIEPVEEPRAEALPTQPKVCHFSQREEVLIDENNNLCDSFNPSDSQSSLEHGNTSSVIKKAAEADTNSIPSQEISLHSFQFNLKKTEEILFSEKDSLEQDISEISSALMKIKDQPLIIDSIEEKYLPSQKTTTNFDKNPHCVIDQNDSLEKFVKSSSESSVSEKKTPEEEQCPISSPNISESMGDIITELLHEEIDYYFELISFRFKEKDVDPSIEFLETYLKSMCEELIPNEKEVLEVINTPGYQEPMLKLKILQNTEVGELFKFLNLELILPMDLCSHLKIKHESVDLKARQIYLQMLFDCVNEALNYIRPFGTRGMPDPWSYHSRTLFGEAEIKNVFEKLGNLMKKWANIKGGAYPTFEMQGDDDKLQELREERMSALLCFEAKSEEIGWVVYDDEEAQTKLDLGEVLFEELVIETLNLLQLI